MRASLRGYADGLKKLSSLVYRKNETGGPADSGATAGPTALFLKTYAADVGRLPYLFRSIDKYARGFEELVIVTDDGCDVGPLPISLPTVIHDLPAPTISHSLERGIGYWWQQAIKMTWPAFSRCSAALILDSDHLITAEMTPESFWSDGAPISARRPWNRSDDGRFWKLGADYFIGCSTENSYMCEPGALLTRAATDGFGSYMKTEFGVGAREFFISKNHGIACSEFELFGAYLQYVDRHGYTFKEQGESINPIRQFQSVNNLSAAQKAAIETILI
jgi:hypothetical protein